jgi:glycosyltransferase involved in cell wall biosynthesis
MLVVYSHLRWDSVWQRPHQLMSRLSKEMPVVFVEEPKFGYARSEMRVRQHGAVTVATPHLAGRSHQNGFGAGVNTEISHLCAPFVPPGTNPAIWYYTPMALGAEPTGCAPCLTVYDVMDDLASFRSAPAELRAREAQLLSRVDLVFTGGPTLYRQRQDRYPAVYCFPSGVEPDHFARRRSTRVARELVERPRPILGYYGVIDERVDLPLLEAVADLRPGWTIVLIGPVAKINPASIPQRPNVLRIGKQDYRRLPAFLAGFDVALLPFARNEATRSISPTKTLEYLAGGKPVVSTPIADVFDLYGDVVEIADGAWEVVGAAEAILRRAPAEKEVWNARVGRLVAANTWDAIAADMLQVMADARAITLPVSEVRTVVPLSA